MHKNKIWLSFLAVMSLIVLWFSWGAGDLLIDYYRHSKPVYARPLGWKVEKLGDEEYALQVSYSYSAGSRDHVSEETLLQPLYRNPWAAEEAIKNSGDERLTAWYNPSSPDSSRILHIFPYKQLLSAAVLWALLFYFCWLGIYVGSRGVGGK